MQWNSAVLSRLERAVEDGLFAAAVVAASNAARNFGSEGNPGPRGGFPGVRTGNLRNSVLAIHPRMYKPGVAAFGTRVMYGRYLEYGRHHRPWIRRTARESTVAMRQAFHRGFRRSMGGR